MKTVQIGIGTEYANNSEDPGLLYNPAVAVNANNYVLSMYGNEVNTLYYNIGTINGAVVDWGGSHRYDDGAYVSVALNNHNEFVEVHRSGTFDDLWWYGGTLQSDGTLRRGEKHQHGNLHDDTVPSIALSNSRIMIGAYQESNTTFKCRIGTYQDQEISFLNTIEIQGTKPCVAFNQTNDFVLVYLNSNGDLYCKVGIVQWNNNTPIITWQIEKQVTGVEHGQYDPTTNFSVAYSTDTIIITYQEHIDLNTYNALKSISGTNTGNGITWDTEPRIFDYGVNPSIAANDQYLVQVHKSENFCDIYYSICLVTDHARWMENLWNTIHNRYLWQIVMPASHDAGMYELTLPEARTQDLSVREQLKGGVRYFDFRPAYDNSGDGTYYINHNGISGADLDGILQDIYDFMHNDQAKELVILKFSHFNNFGVDSTNNSIYETFAAKITDKLYNYLFNTYSHATKFGTIPYMTLVADGGKVLVVCDEYTLNNPTEGIFTYRDGSLECQEEARNDNPTEGNLVVWDCYSNSTTTSDMETQQLAYLSNYKGKCDGPYPNTTCDMFLLSWTLTPWTRSVWQDSENPDRDLGKYMNTVTENQYGQIPNLLYVNYFEFARVTDIAIMLNQRLVATRTHH